MKRVAALLTAALAALGLAGCGAPSTELRLQGQVDDRTVAVTVPQLVWPAVNLDAGFATTGNQPADDASPTAAQLGLGAMATLTRVEVAEGDPVSAGQPVAGLDDRLQRAALAVAEADARVATAQVGVLDARLKDTADAQAELADKRAEVVDTLAELKKKRREVTDAIDELTSTRTDLRKQRAQAAAGRKELTARRAEVAGQLAALPPESPAREPLEQALAQLDAKLAEVNAGLSKLDAGLRKLDSGLKQARSGLSQIKDGIRKATDGLSDLDEAAADLRDARAELTRLRRLARVAAQTADVPVQLAESRVAETAVSAPEAGTVIWAAPVGARLAPGATVAVLRLAGPARATSWLSPAQAEATCLGDPAAVHTDWGTEPIPARVTRLGVSAEYPPTSFATDEVHLTRAFAVEVTTDTDLPAGVPVTITIEPCRGSAAGMPGR